MKTNVMQIVRLVMMIVAVAGIIYALEYMERGIAVWFWITLLGVGFVGLLYTFRLTHALTISTFSFCTSKPIVL